MAIDSQQLNENLSQQSNKFSCFALPDLQRSYQDSKYHDWLAKFEQSDPFETTNKQQLIALSQLIPLLLCGEQSANFVFGQEAKRLQDKFQLSQHENTETNAKDSEQFTKQNKAISGLLAIESDEHFHDVALQAVLKKVKQKIAQIPDEQDDTIANQSAGESSRRKAQLFYLQLGKSNSLVEHFAQIFHLDTCVTIIMSAMAKSNLGSQHQVSQLFKLIQKDESKHVHICSEHIRFLGGDMQQLKKQAAPIKSKLVKLLSTQNDSFMSLGVDPEQIFQRISK